MEKNIGIVTQDGSTYQAVDFAVSPESLGPIWKSYVKISNSTKECSFSSQYINISETSRLSGAGVFCTVDVCICHAFLLYMSACLPSLCEKEMSVVELNVCVSHSLLCSAHYPDSSSTCSKVRAVTLAQFFILPNPLSALSQVHSVGSSFQIRRK